MLNHSRHNKRKTIKKKKSNKILVKKKTQNKRNKKPYSRRHKKQYSKRHKKQYGGKFNDEQIQIIIRAMKNNQEPFTDEQIKEYVQKLNYISQPQLTGSLDSFDDFYGHMLQHLEGLEDETFKQWVDRAYELHGDFNETDVEELETDDED
jgi:uncharacterized protein YpuA (DUF1002 family)